jgi:hypothetical protein
MANHKLVVLPGNDHGGTGGAASFIPELKAFLQNSTPKT